MNIYLQLCFTELHQNFFSEASSDLNLQKLYVFLQALYSLDFVFIALCPVLSWCQVFSKYKTIVFRLLIIHV